MAATTAMGFALSGGRGYSSSGFALKGVNPTRNRGRGGGKDIYYIVVRNLGEEL